MYQNSYWQWKFSKGMSEKKKRKFNCWNGMRAKHESLFFPFTVRLRSWWIQCNNNDLDDSKCGNIGLFLFHLWNSWVSGEEDAGMEGDRHEMQEDSEGHILHSQAAFSYLLLFILYSHPSVETAFTFPPHLFFVCLFTFSFVAAVCGQNCNNLNPVGNLTYLF